MVKVDDVLAAADINVLIVPSRNLYSARLEKKNNSNDKKMHNISIKPKQYCWTVKCILQLSDNLDLNVEGVGINPHGSHACGIHNLPAQREF